MSAARAGAPATAPPPPAARGHRGVDGHRAARVRGRRAARPERVPGAGETLARYRDPAGVVREIAVRSRPGGARLVIDRDARTHGDPRLVAVLDADEPPLNAVLVCREYLRDPAGRWCRPLRADDLRPASPSSRSAPAPGGAGREAPAAETGRAHPPGPAHVLEEVALPGGSRCRLEVLDAEAAPAQLRWRLHDGASEPKIVSLREAIGALESYEPLRQLTARALGAHGDDQPFSTARLRGELERIDASRIVLNRGLREAVQSAVRTGRLSMSEIALRCGRAKRDGRGHRSGETSWLARRIGLMPDGGGARATPWIHSEVLALIARRGLGISPREVELG